jgi:hypothetical protein
MTNDGKASIAADGLMSTVLSARWHRSALVGGVGL